MDREYYLALAKARMDRADELLIESRLLLEKNASDYDDFYISSKEETREQVELAETFVNKVRKYLLEIK